MESDTELITKIRAGDEAAFTRLLDRHLPALYAFALRYTGRIESADDVVQDAWIKIWKHLSRFDAKKNFKSWAFTILKNTALDALKKEKRSLPFSSFESDNGNVIEDALTDEEALPQEVFEQKELGSLLDAALATLPPAQSEVLVLRYKEDLSFDEIAELLGSPLNTVKSWHLRGVRSLRLSLTLKGSAAPKTKLPSY